MSVLVESAKINELVEELTSQNPKEIIARALRVYSRDIAISFSGAEDVALIDMASKTGVAFRVFTLDTGRLHPETYHFIDRVRERYEVSIDVYFPEPEAVERMVREKGMFSFYRDGHKESHARPEGAIRRAGGGRGIHGGIDVGWQRQPDDGLSAFDGSSSHCTAGGDRHILRPSGDGGCRVASPVDGPF